MNASAKLIYEIWDFENPESGVEGVVQLTGSNKTGIPNYVKTQGVQVRYIAVLDIGRYLSENNFPKDKKVTFVRVRGDQTCGQLFNILVPDNTV